jgi:hypothetical protein
VVITTPVPVITIGRFSRSGTVSIMIDAVTGSAPRLLVEPKSAFFTGSRKISGSFRVGLGPVMVGSAKLTGAAGVEEPLFSASLLCFLDW